MLIKKITKKYFQFVKKNNVYLIEDCAISYKGNSKKNSNWKFK